MQKLRDVWIVSVAVVATTAKRVTFMLTHLHTLRRENALRKEVLNLDLCKLNI